MSSTSFNPYAPPQSDLGTQQVPIPAHSANPDRYKTIFKRMLAFIIDCAFIIIPSVVIEYTVFDWDYKSIPSLVFDLSISIVFLIYNVSLHSIFGQTIGKRFMHLRLLDISERNSPGWLSSIKKETSYILLDIPIKIYILFLVWHQNVSYRTAKGLLSYKILIWLSTIWLIIELITMLSTKKRREPNDFLADTVLVSEA